ncbi:hypothetical protein P7K49_000548, partial [Saguinus oedipus]
MEFSIPFQRGNKAHSTGPGEWVEPSLSKGLWQGSRSRTQASIYRSVQIASGDQPLEKK